MCVCVCVCARVFVFVCVRTCVCVCVCAHVCVCVPICLSAHLCTCLFGANMPNHHPSALSLTSSAVLTNDDAILRFPFAAPHRAEDEYTVQVDDGKSTRAFNFDRVFLHHSTQDEVYEDTGNLIQSAVDGFNVCIFAYGQTGQVFGSADCRVMGKTKAGRGVVVGVVERNNCRW